VTDSYVVVDNSAELL